MLKFIFLTIKSNFYLLTLKFDWNIFPLILEVVKLKKKEINSWRIQIIFTFLKLWELPPSGLPRCLLFYFQIIKGHSSLCVSLSSSLVTWLHGVSPVYTRTITNTINAFSYSFLLYDYTLSIFSLFCDSCYSIYKNI